MQKENEAKLAEFKGKLERCTACETPDGVLLVFRAPTGDEYEAAKDAGGNGPQLRQLALKTCVWPESVDKVQEQLERFPQMQYTLGNRLAELAGAAIEFDVKKG